MEIKSRTELGELYESVKETGMGAEIGVQRGLNSVNIYRGGWEGKILCVDTWNDSDAYEQAQRDLGAINNAVLGADVFYLRKDNSVDASKTVINESLDWVYIDADHSYEGIKSDYNAWYDKVRVGGIISGHDYGLNGDCEGVKQFIDELTESGIEMHFTTDDFFEGRPYQTWWFIKK